MKIQITPEKHIFLYQNSIAKKQTIHNTPIITNENLNQYTIKATRNTNIINFQYLDTSPLKHNNYLTPDSFHYIMKKLISDAYMYKFIHLSKKDYYNSEFEVNGKVSKFHNDVWRVYKKSYLRLQKLGINDSDILLAHTIHNLYIT